MGFDTSDIGSLVTYSIQDGYHGLRRAKVEEIWFGDADWGEIDEFENTVLHYRERLERRTCL